MRIASFNVENLFSRARALNQDDFSEGKPILNEFSKLNILLEKPSYSADVVVNFTTDGWGVDVKWISPLARA